MNETITPAAPGTDGRGLPDPLTTGGTSTDPMDTLLTQVATYRPLEQVTTLVALLNKTEDHPELVHQALRTAAVARPVHEVEELIGLLGNSPLQTAEVEIALRALAAERPIEDVALLISGRAARAPGEPVPGPDPWTEPGAPAEPAAGPPAPTPADAVAVAGPEDGTGNRPGWAVRAPQPPAAAPPDRAGRPDPRTAVRGGRAAAAEAGAPDWGRRTDAPRDAARTPAVWRRALRWPLVLALLAVAGLQLPAEPQALASAAPGHLVVVLGGAVCLLLGLLVAVRDSAVVWRQAALGAAVVVVLHLLARAARFDALTGCLGETVPGADVTVVLCAAAAAVLAAAPPRLAVRRRAAAE
ncbi:hypothetical protein [Streptomyces sp. NPDC012888]|uniref:hypothetical protein n=1 Tax=Streptomyces sp. NPDC012888 TaxID=3364855 RepID=UPI0036881B83